MKATLIPAGVALLAIGVVMPAFAITATEAEQAALEAYPGGKVTAAAELQDEDGVQVYGVAVTAADGKMWDVKVDAGSGKVLKSDPDDPGGSEGSETPENDAGTASAPRHAAKTLSAGLAPAQAVAAAVAAQPGAATMVELEDEDGTTVYGVHLTDKSGRMYDVKVDANTGKVLKREPDAPGGSEGAPGSESSESGAEPAGTQMARILAAGLTPAQAQTAAPAAQAGTVSQVELEDEDGTAVYGVHITAVNGQMYDVKVDATTDKVLMSEPDGPDGAEGTSAEPDSGGAAGSGGGDNSGDQTN